MTQIPATQMPAMDARDDSDDMPLDGEHEFSSEERARLRRILRDEAHATWLRRRIKVIVPWVITVAGATVAAVDYIVKHWKP